MTLLQAYEQLRGKIFARREQLLLEREQGLHWRVFLGTFWLLFLELRSVFLRFLIINFSDPTQSFKILLNLKPEDVCTYSYCSYRYLKKKMQLFSFAGTSMIIIGSVAATFLLSIILPLLALRAQTVNWQTRPAGTVLKKNNLFAIADWPRGYFMGTSVADNQLVMASGTNYGTGLDGQAVIAGNKVWSELVANDGQCAGKLLASKINIFDIEEQAITLRRALGDNDCLKVGDEVVILYYSLDHNKEVFASYDTNYIQSIRGRRLILSSKFAAKPATIAYVMRVPQLTEMRLARAAKLKGDAIFVRAKLASNQSSVPVINLTEANVSSELGTWLSPVYEINTLDTFVQKIAWDGQSLIARDVRIEIGSGNNKNALQWDGEELTGCTMRTPCAINPRHFNKKYIQTKLILASEGKESPKIKGINIVTNTGFVSEAAMVGILNYRLLGLHILSPDVPDVLVQVRGGKTLEELKQAPWCGFSSCVQGDFFTADNFQESISADHDLAARGNRWFQYRLFSVNPHEELSRTLVRNIKLKLQSISIAVGKQ